MPAYDILTEVFGRKGVPKSVSADIRNSGRATFNFQTIKPLRQKEYT